LLPSSLSTVTCSALVCCRRPAAAARTEQTPEAVTPDPLGSHHAARQPHSVDSDKQHGIC
jgi:hypothetical protein